MMDFRGVFMVLLYSFIGGLARLGGLVVGWFVWLGDLVVIWLADYIDKSLFIVYNNTRNCSW